MNHKNFMEICNKERRHMRGSYTLLFEFINKLEADKKIKFSYVKNFNKQGEELHLFTDNNIIVAKRFDTGENTFKSYPLGNYLVKYNQDWNNFRSKKLVIELEESVFTYDSQQDCNDDWTSEYAYQIEQLALLMFK